ncbi:unnamed protein product, partial [Ectocarpus sp. 8 AP-2014]
MVLSIAVGRRWSSFLFPQVGVVDPVQAERRHGVQAGEHDMLDHREAGVRRRWHPPQDLEEEADVQLPARGRLSPLWLLLLLAAAAAAARRRQAQGAQQQQVLLQ